MKLLKLVLGFINWLFFKIKPLHMNLMEIVIKI